LEPGVVQVISSVSALRADAAREREEVVRIRLEFRRTDAEFAEAVDARGQTSLRRSWNLKDSVVWLADPKWATLLSATPVPPVPAGEE